MTRSRMFLSFPQTWYAPCGWWLSRHWCHQRTRGSGWRRVPCSSVRRGRARLALRSTAVAPSWSIPAAHTAWGFPSWSSPLPAGWVAWHPGTSYRRQGEVDGDEGASWGWVDAHVVHCVIKKLCTSVALHVMWVIVSPVQLDVQPVLLCGQPIHCVSVIISNINLT